MADLLVNNPNWQQFASGLEQDRGLQPGLLRAVAMNETGGGNPNIINQTSSAGAQGMFQFMPGTAADHNVNVNDPADSTRGAADYLQDLTKKFGDPLLAGAAYNWGPGNVVQAQAAAAKVGLPTDAMSLAQNGFLPKETANYVGKLAAQIAPQAQASTPAPAQAQAFSPDVVNAVQTGVVGMVQRGLTPTAIVQALGKTQVAPMIQALSSSGLSDADIVQQVGGTPLAQAQAAQAAVRQQSFLTNLKQGASNAISDLGAGASQLGARLTGDDAQLAQLQAQQAATQADPTRQAQDNTAGGMIGSGGVKALPYVIGTALAPEATLPMILANAGVGAGMGALKPTTGSGQILPNIGTEAALGGAGAGVGSLVGGGLARAGLKAISGDAGATARLADAQAQGLPASVGSVAGPNSFWRNVADNLPENGSVNGFSNQADAAIAQKVGEGLGLQNYAGPIDHNMIGAAKPAIQKALDDSTDFMVTLPSTMRTDLDALMQANTNPLTEGIANNSMVKTAVANLSNAADAATPVSGQQLQGLASDLKSIIYNQTATAGEKQLASNVVSKINTTLTSSMTPEQQAAFATANDQYRHLLAVQKLVANTNDTGVVTPRALLQAAKNGSFRNAFLQGNAPYQDLATTAAGLYGPSSNKGLGSVIAKATGGHDGLITVAALEPTTGLPALAIKKLAQVTLGKLASSQNPATVRLLTGAGGKQLDPALAHYIAKATGGLGAASTGS